MKTKKKLQYTRVTETLNALLVFANARNATCIYFEPPIENDIEAMCAIQISHELWEDESLVNQYLESDLPYSRGVNTGLISQWNDALHGPVVCMETHGDKALILCEGAVFEVVSFGKSWDSFVPYVPDVIVTTLLPVDNVISFDGLVLHHPCHAEGSGAQRVQAEFKAGCENGIIRDSAQYAVEAQRIKHLWKTEGLDPTSYWVFSGFIHQLNNRIGDKCFPYELDLPLREWNEASHVLINTEIEGV